MPNYYESFHANEMRNSFLGSWDIRYISTTDIGNR